MIFRLEPMYALALRASCVGKPTLPPADVAKAGAKKEVVIKGGWRVRIVVVLPSSVPCCLPFVSLRL